jgi:hypothetical protein
MQTIQLNISRDILDKVMFLLDNLPNKRYSNRYRWNEKLQKLKP